MDDLYYIAIARKGDIKYIYRAKKPRLGERINYNGEYWIIAGYMPVYNNERK